MFSKLIFEKDKELRQWASQQIMGRSDCFDNLATAIGITINDKLSAVVVYNNYSEYNDGRPHKIEMSIASIDKRWAQRHNIRAFFAYPFAQLRLERVQTLCSATNEGVIKFNERLGFKKEGYHRNAWPCGGDAISWSMLKNECKWIL